MNGLDDIFLTQLALMPSGDGETGLEDVVVVIVELLGLEDDMEVVWFELPLLIVYMYPPKLLPLLPLPFLV